MVRTIYSHKLLLATAAMASCFCMASVASADDVPGNSIPNVHYDSVTGALTVNPDGADLVSILIPGPQATTIDRWVDPDPGTPGDVQDGVTDWDQRFFNGKEQWVGSGGATSGNAVTPNDQTYQIATYATGLDLSVFGEVEVGAQDPNSPGVGGLIIFTDVTAPPTVGGGCDFDNSGSCTAVDIDMMTALGDLTAGVSAAGNEQFDLDNSGTIDGDDINEWLALNGAEDGFAGAYLLGDLTFDLDPPDGAVNFQDFVILNNSFAEAGQYSNGDLNGSGTVNFQDFVILNNNFAESVPMALAAAAVPEPTGLALVLISLVGLGLRRRR